MGGPAAWGALAIGLVIVVLAVGIPYFLTHRSMPEPRDSGDSHAYLRMRRRVVSRRRMSGPGTPGAAGPDHRS